MKSHIYLILAASILTACSSTKQTQEEKPVTDIVIHDTMEIKKKKDTIASLEKEVPVISIFPPAPKDAVIQDKGTITIGKGAKIGTTIPIRDMPVITEKDITVDHMIEINPQQVIPPTSPIEIINNETIDHDSFNALLQKHVAVSGIVNYTGFAKDKNKLRNYITTLGANLPTESWSKNKKLAYWMNAYNAMTVDLIVRNMPLKSIKDIKKPWEQRLWKLGSKWYNLEDIEHQILRKMGDARIHFGINCASFSCPPLSNKAFTAITVDAQLEALAVQFVNDKQRNSIGKDRVEISKIFTWFSKDFKQNGSIIAYLNQFSKLTIDKSARVRYMDYNWELNNK